MVDYARVSMELEKLRPPKLTGTRPARREKRDRHAQTKVAFFRYGYYDIAFKYFTERVLDAEFVPLPPATRRTLELGSQHSNDFVCAPFKHILGDYLEALELGADVLVQFTGPCRLGYYGEVQESILRDLGYDFQMLNFAVVSGKPATEYVKLCRRTVNPNVSLKQGALEMVTTFRLIECRTRTTTRTWSAQASQSTLTSRNGCRGRSTARCARRPLARRWRRRTRRALRRSSACPSARWRTRCAWASSESISPPSTRTAT